MNSFDKVYYIIGILISMYGLCVAWLFIITQYT